MNTSASPTSVAPPDNLADLRARLDEAEQTLNAIRHGDVDALVVAGPQGDRIYTLSGAEHVYRTVVETMFEAALTVGPDGTIRFCNQRFCDLLQTPMHTTVGQKLGGFVDPQPEPLQQLLRDAQSQPVQRRLVFRASDGTPRPLLLSASLLPVDGEANVCLVASDLRELEASANSIKILREHEQALEASRAELHRQREWFRVTLASIGDAVIATDTAGLITFINPVAERLTGRSAAEALGQPVQTVFRVINEKTQQPLEDLVRRVLRERCVVPLANDSALQTKDERVIAVEDSAAPIKDSAGQLIGVVLVFHDVTEKRRAQDELRASNAQLAHFNRAMVGRELRMIELKKEVNALCAETGLPRRYSLESEQEQGESQAKV